MPLGPAGTSKNAESLASPFDLHQTGLTQIKNPLSGCCKLIRGMNAKALTRFPSSPSQLCVLARAVESAASAIFVTDADGRILWVNDAFCRLSGYSTAEVRGHTPRFLKSGAQDQAFYRDLWRAILAGRVWRGEVTERRKDGTLYTVDEVITPLRDERGTVTHFVTIQNDITQRKQESEHDRFLAYHDPLTGLPNRRSFLHTLRHATERARRTGPPVVLLFLDLDNFKAINDTRGHATGDRLLTAVARRLRAAVRTSDIVARLGGDEFAILQFDLRNAGEVAKHLLDALAQPFVLRGQRLSVSASIGIVEYPLEQGTPEELLDKADQAMYRAKRLGRGTYHGDHCCPGRPHTPARPENAPAPFHRHPPGRRTERAVHRRPRTHA